MNRENLRAMVRGAYDLQKLRIQAGNRIVANFKTRLGHEPGTKEEETISDKRAQMLLNRLKVESKRLTDGVARLGSIKEFPAEGLIADLTELCLVCQYTELLDEESQHFKRLGLVLKGFPLWTDFLDEVKGVGPAMAGVIISEIDIAKAEYPSSIWKYAGLDVAEDGRGRSRRKEHLVRVQYFNKDGMLAERNSITFNPWLKTKLLGVLGPSFLRAKGDYYDEYNHYKARLRNRPDLQEESKLHLHNMANRYMVKRFLADLYLVWRKLEGLPLAEEYSRAKLGMVHGRA